MSLWARAIVNLEGCEIQSGGAYDIFQSSNAEFPRLKSREQVPNVVLFKLVGILFSMVFSRSIFTRLNLVFVFYAGKCDNDAPPLSLFWGGNL